MRASCSAAVAALLLLASGVAGVDVSAQPSLESKLKAAIVSKFPQFVEWPATALAGRDTATLCVAAPDPFGGDLQQLVEGETVGGRAIEVRTIDRDQDIDSCHLLFVPAGSAERRALLQRASTRPILTVGDDQRFLDEGGIVRLRLVDGRVRFDVNAAAAQRVGLRISSQLLQLAVTVRGGQP